MSSNDSSSSPRPWTPPTVEELHEMIPQYEIETMLGRGGMGAVYLGKQAALDRSVAIKILPLPEDSKEDEHNFTERFKLEAKAMAGLDHPAIISVHDFGQTDTGLLYFVMEFVDGMDIQKYIQLNDGVVTPEHAVAIVSHVLDALDYAHSKGIIHRDIKPANVLINQEGKVKIADFGLAKQINPSESEVASGLTMSNVALGTPDYIAPESLDPDATPDHRADLYAVGVMLYQMLTGKLPRGMFKLPSEVKKSIDPRFDEVITLALESDPAHRYQSATQFRSVVGELLTKPVPKVVAADQQLPEKPSNSIVPGRSVVAVPKREMERARHRQKKKSTSFAWLMAIVILGTCVAWYFFRVVDSNDEDISFRPAKTLPKTEPEPPSVPSTESPPQIQKPHSPVSTVSEKSGGWPTGPHFQSAGRFRAWSSIPNDPLIDIAKLADITDPKQIEFSAGLWVVLRDNGETISSNQLAEKKGIAKLSPGTKAISLITEEGEFFAFNAKYRYKPLDLTETLKPVTNVSISWHFGVALLADSSLKVWGPSASDLYKGITAPKWSREFVENPIPQGAKAVSIQGTTNTFSVLLDDGSLLLRHLNDVQTYESPFLDTVVETFVDSDAGRVGIPVGGGQAISSRIRPDEIPKPIPHRGNARHLISGDGKVLILNDNGEPYIFPASGQLEKQIAELLPLIPYAEPGLISVDAKLPRNASEEMRLLWFETDAPQESRTESPESELSEPTVPKEGGKQMAKKGPDRESAEQNESAPVALNSEQAILPPEVQPLTREIVRVQKSRLSQFSNLVDLYLQSLNRIRRKESADHAGAIDDEMEAITQWRTHSVSQLRSLAVAPIPAPPTASETVSKEIRRNRAVLVKQINLIDVTNRQELETGIRRVISDLRKAQQHERAVSTEAYRTALASSFPVSSADPASQEIEELPSLLTEMSLRQGQLRIWSNQPNDPITDLSRAEDREDFVQAYLFQGGWIALTSRGETRSSDPAYERSRIAKICRGWESSFGLIDFDGNLEAMTIEEAKLETQLTGVIDAYISAIHSIALLKNGRIKTWGPAYRGETPDKLKWEQAPDDLRDIVAVKGSPTVGAAVSEDGTLTAWTFQGPARIARNINFGIRDFTTRSSGLRIISEEGHFYWWNSKDYGSRQRIDLVEEIGPISEILDSMNANLLRPEGTRTIVTDHRDILAAGIDRYLVQLEGAPEHAFSLYDDQGLYRLIWIEYGDEK